jgi:hypothetical protein
MVQEGSPVRNVRCGECLCGKSRREPSVVVDTCCDDVAAETWKGRDNSNKVPGQGRGRSRTLTRAADSHTSLSRLYISTRRSRHFHKIEGLEDITCLETRIFKRA